MKMMKTVLIVAFVVLSSVINSIQAICQCNCLPGLVQVDSEQVCDGQSCHCNCKCACPDCWNLVDSKCYLMSTERLSYADANQYCINLKASLMVC